MFGDPPPPPVCTSEFIIIPEEIKPKNIYKAKPAAGYHRKFLSKKIRQDNQNWGGIVQGRIVSCPCSAVVDAGHQHFPFQNFCLHGKNSKVKNKSE
jgi:hypothetical protein